MCSHKSLQIIVGPTGRIELFKALGYSTADRMECVECFRPAIFLTPELIDRAVCSGENSLFAYLRMGFKATTKCTSCASSSRLQNNRSIGSLEMLFFYVYGEHAVVE